MIGWFWVGKRSKVRQESVSELTVTREIGRDLKLGPPDEKPIACMKALPASSKTLDPGNSKRYFELIGGRLRRRVRLPDAHSVPERVAFFIDTQLESDYTSSSIRSCRVVSAASSLDEVAVIPGTLATEAV